MKEIGGYFGLENLICNEYYKNLVALNSGRNALLYLLRARNVKKIYIPYFLCDSVTDMLNMHDYDFECYNINSDFTPIFNKIINNDECLYVVNYYGQLDNDKVICLKEKYNHIILDNTHAFFQKPIEYIDTIYTCRKFFGVPDGAYLSTDIKIKDKLKIDISKDRMIHILGRYEGAASEYYNDFQNSDKAFNSEPLKYMSKLTHNILGAIDYERVREIRNKNYTYLDDKLGIHNKLKLNTPDGAFAYPFYMENGTDIRRKLASRKIYIPVLWPNVLSGVSGDGIGQDYAANILPLPCDQRYTINDMNYIIQELKKVVLE